MINVLNGAGGHAALQTSTRFQGRCIVWLTVETIAGKL